PGRYGAGPTDSRYVQRTSMDVFCRRRGRVAEDVGALHQRPEPADRRLEHMFERVGKSSDGTTLGLRPGARSSGTRAGYAADPSDDHTSSLVRTRSTTASV